MKNIIHSLPVKLALTVLLTVSLALNIFDFMFVIWFGPETLFEKDADYYSSNYCENLSLSYANGVINDYSIYLRTYEGSDAFDTEDGQFILYSQSDNFACKVTVGGEEAADNLEAGISYREMGEFSDRISYEYYDPELGGYVYYGDETDVPVTVTYYLREPMLEEFDDSFYLGYFIYTARCGKIGWVIADLVLTVVLMGLVIVSAGKVAPDGSLTTGLKWLPPDIFLVCVAAVLGLLASMYDELGFFIYSLYELLLKLFLMLLAGATLSLAVSAVSAKLREGRFIKSSVIYKILHGLWRLCGRIVSAAAGVCRNMSVLWKVILGYALLMFLNVFFLFVAYWSPFGVLVLIALQVAVLGLLCVTAMNFDELKKAGCALAAGKLEHKVNTRNLIWDFKTHGETLNNIGAGMSAAVEERIKSERFRTELITNVSHDIKTPITSIVNYVDLLSKEELQNERAAEYLEVLNRQSIRLKKLTEDLIEASKAATGSITVNFEPVNVAELVSQALGEYDERMAQRQLTPVFNSAEQDPVVWADGRLLWRIIDNLLSNICKYAQGGTRVYVDILCGSEGVTMMFRNISNYQLNISSDELKERFVRGDASRSTEGSGLGLSIAESLSRIQGGRFNIMVDGDLFKAMIIMPRCKNGGLASAENSVG